MPSATTPSYATCVCLTARRISRRLSQAFDLHLAPAGLKATQFAILSALTMVGPGGARLSGLADGLDMDASTLSRNLKPLVRDGLVELRRGEDGRERKAALTAAGATRVREATPLWEAARAEALGALGADAPTVLMNLLQRVRSL